MNIEHRLKIDGGRSLFAWLDFRLIPSEDSGVTLTFAWLENDNERWEAAIQKALNTFLNSRREAGRPVEYTRIEMHRVISHPIDTDAHAVEYNMTRALEAAFRTHEIEHCADCVSRKANGQPHALEPAAGPNSNGKSSPPAQ